MKREPARFSDGDKTSHAQLEVAENVARSLIPATRAPPFDSPGKSLRDFPGFAQGRPVLAGTDVGRRVEGCPACPE